MSLTKENQTKERYIDRLNQYDEVVKPQSFRKISAQFRAICIEDRLRIYIYMRLWANQPFQNMNWLRAYTLHLPGHVIDEFIRLNNAYLTKKKLQCKHTELIEELEQFNNTFGDLVKIKYSKRLEFDKGKGILW